MTKKQVLDFKPSPRLEQVDAEHSKRMQEREHRPRSCGDSTRRCDSQAGWDFRKGQVFSLAKPPAAGLKVDFAGSPQRGPAFSLSPVHANILDRPLWAVP